jgi:hypothetical protein
MFIAMIDPSQYHCFNLQIINHVDELFLNSNKTKSTIIFDKISHDFNGFGLIFNGFNLIFDNFLPPKINQIHVLHNQPSKPNSLLRERKKKEGGREIEASSTNQIKASLLITLMFFLYIRWCVVFLSFFIAPFISLARLDHIYPSPLYYLHFFNCCC